MCVSCWPYAAFARFMYIFSSCFFYFLPPFLSLSLSSLYICHIYGDFNTLYCLSWRKQFRYVLRIWTRNVSSIAVTHSKQYIMVTVVYLSHTSSTQSLPLHAWHRKNKKEMHNMKTLLGMPSSVRVPQIHTMVLKMKLCWIVRLRIDG